MIYFYLEESNFWMLRWKSIEKRFDLLTRSAPVGKYIDNASIMMLDGFVVFLLTVEFKNDSFTLFHVKSASNAGSLSSEIHSLRVVGSFQGSWIKHRVSLSIGLVLHSTDHIPNHGSHWSFENIKWHVNNEAWNSCSCQERSTFVCEIVAIVLEQIIGFLGELRTDFFEEVKEDTLWKLGFTKWDFLDRGSVRGHSRWSITDSSSEVVFLKKVRI